MVLLLSYLVSALVCTTFYPAVGTVSARKIDRKHIQDLRQQAADRFNKNRLAVPSVEDSVRLSEGVKNFTFSNPASSGRYLSHKRVSRICGIRVTVLTGGTVAFYVDGTSIPEVDWDIGPSWAGLLPISENEDETRQASKVPKCSSRVLKRSNSCSFGSSHLGLRGVKIH